MNDSNYVFTEPESSMETLDAGADNLTFQPTSMEPVVIENIVTSKLQDPDDTYHVQKPYMASEKGGEGKDIPPYCGLIKNETGDNSETDEDGLLDNLTMENIRAYIEGISPEQWKKYGLIAGGVLLGRRILFGGRK